MTSRNEIGGAFSSDNLIGFHIDENILTLRDKIDVNTLSVRLSDRHKVVSEISTNDFPFPVDRALRVSAEELTVRHTLSTYLRDLDGEFIQPLKDRADLQRGSYCIELTSEVKGYIRIYDAAPTIQPVIDGEYSPHITTESPTTFDIGVRSAHSSPATTITVPDDPEAIMTALSHSGTALKELSCERSWPSLRGHPPAIKLGDELEIPESIEPPDTGVTIEVPPRYSYIHPTATAAYYFGADVQPGSKPRIYTKSGREHLLGDTPTEVSNRINTLLYKCLLLDCVVRNGGYYTIDSGLGDLSDALRFNPDDLYTASVSECLDQYLDVPIDIFQQHGVEVYWPSVATVSPTVTDTEYLPNFVNQLALITLEQPTTPEPSLSQRLREWFPDSLCGRTPKTQQANIITDEGAPFLETAQTATDPYTHHYSTSKNPDSSGTYVPKAAFQNRIYRNPIEEGLDIRVVCNSEDMTKEAEHALEEYVNQTRQDTNTSVHYNVTTYELASILSEPHHLFHFIGHSNEDGLKCSNGRLDIETLSAVGPDIFILNACDSYEQGVHMVENGSITGVTTVTEVPTNSAIQVGAQLTELLASGYVLGQALRLCSVANPMFSPHYTLVGEETVTLASNESGITTNFEVINTSSEDEHRYQMLIRPGDPTDGAGSTSAPLVKGLPDEHHLSPASIGPFTLSTETIEEIVGVDESVVILNGEFYWSNDITPDVLEKSIQNALD